MSHTHCLARTACCILRNAMGEIRAAFCSLRPSQEIKAAMSDKDNVVPEEQTARSQSASRWLIVRGLLRDPVSSVAITMILALVLISAVGAELIAPFDPLEQDLKLRNMPPHGTCPR